MKNITLQEMLKAGVHFGHQTSRWHPKMEPYIFCQREGIHIIDLQKTQEKLKEALEFIKKLASSGKKILFVGTKKQAKEIVKKAAESCQMPYIIERWLGGTFTNFKTIHKQIVKLRDLEKKQKLGEFNKYTKKEQLLISEEIARLERFLGGIKELDELPGAVFVVDAVRDALPVKEARRVNIPVVALVDTNANPELIDWPIPSNDDAIKVIELMVNTVAEVIKENYKSQEHKNTRTLEH